MQSESQCRFCAKLPVIHNAHAGMPTRCPLCKGQLIEARGSGTTYRYQEPPEGPPQSRSLGRRLAALLGISAAIVLVWFLVKPHAPEMAVAAQIKPKAQDREVAQVPELPDPVVDESPRYAMAKSGAGMVALSAKSSAGEVRIASKPYSSKGVAKNNPGYLDTVYSSVKPWSFQPREPVPLPKQRLWDTYSEETLLAMLRHVRGLEPKRLAKPPKTESAKDHSSYLAELKKANSELDGLPFLLDDCQMQSTEGKRFEMMARGLRRQLSVVSESTSAYTKRIRSYYPSETSRYSYHYEMDAAEKCLTLDAAAAQAVFLLQTRFVQGASTLTGPALLQQMMMDQDKILRYALVNLLREIASKEATTALAKRAIFDPDPDVRVAAVKALEGRAKEDYTPVLLDGLRYPWPAVPNHAARALVDLNRRDVIPQLVKILEQPEPDAPFVENGKTKIRELVAVNHNKNCLLCHAPSNSVKDSVRAIVPSPSLPLPAPFSFEYYPERSRRDGEFVRADVTYLRQDFSAPMEVADPGKWPKMQRHDFLVRVRELTADEAKAAQNQQRPEVSEYKLAVLFALRNLTDIDAGTTAAAWRECLRHPPFGTEK